MLSEPHCDDGDQPDLVRRPKDLCADVYEALATWIGGGLCRIALERKIIPLFSSWLLTNHPPAVDTAAMPEVWRLRPGPETQI